MNAALVKALAAAALLATVLLSVPAAALSNTSTTAGSGRLSQTDIYLLVIVLLILGALSYLRPKPKVPEGEEIQET